MGAEQGAGVDVVGVVLAPAHVSRGHEETVVVLVGRHHGAQLVGHGEEGVAARVAELGVHVLDDALPQERYRMVLLPRSKLIRR